MCDEWSESGGWVISLDHIVLVSIREFFGGSGGKGKRCCSTTRFLMR
jgi:hypothetical protein